MRPVTLEAVCDRFEILLHRYSLFTAELPSRFKAWISAASESKQIFSTLESVCIEMFPQQLPPGRDGWILSAAMLALRHFIVQCKGVELSECGKGLRIFGELVPPPVVRPAPPVNGMLLVQTLSRNAVLQARVLELECRLDRRPKKGLDRRRRSGIPRGGDRLPQRVEGRGGRRSAGTEAWAAEEATCRGPPAPGAAANRRTAHHPTARAVDGGVLERGPQRSAANHHGPGAGGPGARRVGGASARGHEHLFSGEREGLSAYGGSRRYGAKKRIQKMNCTDCKTPIAAAQAVRLASCCGGLAHAHCVFERLVQCEESNVLKYRCARCATRISTGEWRKTIESRKRAHEGESSSC